MSQRKRFEQTTRTVDIYHTRGDDFTTVFDFQNFETGAAAAVEVADTAEFILRREADFDSEVYHSYSTSGPEMSIPQDGSVAFALSDVDMNPADWSSCWHQLTIVKPDGSRTSYMAGKFILLQPGEDAPVV